MRLLRGKEGGGGALAAAAVAVAVAGLAVLVSTAEGPAAMAHAQLGGVTEQSMIVVVDRGNDRLQAFYPDGTFAFKFGAGHGQARSIAVGPDGRIVVSGSEYGYAPVEVYHPDGSYAFRLAEDGTSIGRVRYGQVAVGPDGRFVVLDHGGSRIQVFNSDGSFASSFGWDVRGIAYAQHDTDVAVGPDGRIVVADPRYECSYGGQHPTPPLIRIFHPNGTPVLSFTPASQGGYSDCPVVWNVDVGPNGSIVAEVGRHGGAVQVYRPLANGSFVFAGEVDGIASGTGLAVGANGRIVVGNQNNTVSVYHPNGSLALAFGSYGRVGGGFESPTDAVVSPDGRIVVAEPGNHSVRVFYPNGTFAFAFGGYGHGDGKFYEPHQVAVSPDGRIVVGDTGKNRILVFEPDGSPALAFGSHGHGAGEIDGLRDVAVAPNGSVVVVDGGSGHGRVQVFSPDGSTVSELRHDDYDRYSGWGSGWYPGRVAVGPDGRIVVAEGSGYGDPDVHIFEPNGTVAFTVQLDWAADGIAVGPDGRFVAVQGSRSQVFNPDGTFAFATEIDADAVSVAVGPNREIVVVDNRDGRVQVFNPNGTFAFSLLPDLYDGRFAGVGPVAVGPVVPRVIVDPEPLWVAVGPDMDGPILRNFTGAGDAANVTIDVAGLAGPGAPLNGSESSTVTFPQSETVVAASFAEVTFPSNVTASHVPAGGRLALRIAADVPAAEQVQAALGRNGSGPELIVLLQSVVEVGAEGSRIIFDLPVRISLEGQAGGRAFYIEGPNATIVPIDEACAADDVDVVHRQLGSAGECQMDSADGTAKIIHTYHLTKFGTVSAEGPVPGIVVDPVPVPAPRPAAPGRGSNSTNGTVAPPPVVVAPTNATNGTVTPPPPPEPVPPPPVVVQPVAPGGPPVVLPPAEGPTCSVHLAYGGLALDAMPGKYSAPFAQEVFNAGSLPFEQVEIVATPWQDAAMPLPAAPSPALGPSVVTPGAGTAPSVFTAYLLATMPASVTEVLEGPRFDGRQFVAGGGDEYVPLADGKAVVLRGLEAGTWAQLSFRLNLTPYDALQGGTLTQGITYQAECVPP